MKLNLGCGGDVREGWENIDLYCKKPGVIYGDAAALHYPANSIDEINAQDILEHFSHREVVGVLTRWIALLWQGGVLTIRCPDALKQCELLRDGVWDWSLFSHMMFGGQDYEGNYHKVAFTLTGLCTLLRQLGMEIRSFSYDHVNLNRERTSNNANFVVEAVKK